MTAGPAPHRRLNNVEAGARKLHAVQLRLEGRTFRQIAADLDLSVARVHEIVSEALAEYVDPAVHELRRLEVERLDDLASRAYSVLNAEHVTIQHGKIVRDEDGKPVRDHAPVLAAINSIRQLSDSRRRLLGLDAPVQIAATVHKVDATDLELMAILRVAKEKNDRIEAQIKGLPVPDRTQDGPEGAA